MRGLFATIILIVILLCAVVVSGQTSGSTASKFKSVSFSQLGTPADNQVRWCSNCQATAPCTSGGTGAYAYGETGGAWNCNLGAGGGGGTPGGSDTQVQFNDSSTFGGDAGLVYDKITGALTVGGAVATGDGTVAGELATYELAANGTNYLSWLAPDAVTTTQRLRLPATANTVSQVLSFAAPSSNISQAAWINIPYDVAVFYENQPAGSSLFKFVAATSFSSTANFVGTVCHADVAADAQADFLVKKNGSLIATLRFAAAADTCTIVGGTTTSFAAGDRLTIEAPTIQDATLDTVSITIKGILN